METLGGLDIDDVAEKVYRTLLRMPGATVAELSDIVDIGTSQVRRALVSLERSGLVTRTPPPTARFLPVAPDVGIEALVLRKEGRLDAIRRLAESLMTDYRGPRRPDRPS